MHFEEYIDNLLNRQKSIGDAYLQRPLYAQSVVNRQKSGINRPVTLPYLLNDLGARRSDSPFLLAQEAAAKAETEILSTEMLIQDLLPCNMSFYQRTGKIRAHHRSADDNGFLFDRA